MLSILNLALVWPLGLLVIVNAFTPIFAGYGLAKAVEINHWPAVLTTRHAVDELGGGGAGSAVVEGTFLPTQYRTNVGSITNIDTYGISSTK